MAVTKYIFRRGQTASSFAVPSDFVSLVSLEALGCGGFGDEGNNATFRFAGGGGGAYSKTLGSSITTPIVAGQIIYFSSPTTGQTTDSWINVNPLSFGVPPTSTSDGVLAKFGARGLINNAGAGGLASSGIGNVRYSGGNGGAGSTGSRNTAGGGGGAAGPNGGGGNGGAAFNTLNRGHGGGGGANVGANGGAGLTAQGGSGGTGGSGTAAGGTGGTAGSPSGTAGSSSSSGAGGGGGGFGASALNITTNSSGIYTYVAGATIGAGGAGGFSGTLGDGAGKGGNLGNRDGGSGWIIFTYLASDPPNGNFFFLF